MSSKTLKVDNDVHEALKKVKNGDETFSGTVSRLIESEIESPIFDFAIEIMFTVVFTMGLMQWWMGEIIGASYLAIGFAGVVLSGWLKVEL